MTIEDISEFYRTYFVPAYADLVGHIGDKPQQVLVELENISAHILGHFDPNLDSKSKEENIKKAASHLQRATLDCYKLLWVTINDDLVKINNDRNIRRFGLNISESDFITQLQEFRKLAKEARNIELKNVGIDPISSIKKYREAVDIGNKLLDCIDPRKIEEIGALMRFVSTKEFITGIFIGTLAGLISGFILALII